MTLPIERWARQAVMLERKGDFSPVASKSVWADIEEAKALQRQTWVQRSRMLEDQPTALEGVYAGLNAYPPAGAIATTPAATTETLLWTPGLYTPIPANGTLSPEAYRVAVTASVLYAATPGTSTYTNRWGTLVSSPTLGAFAAITGTASATANWTLIGDFTIRATGVGATASSVIGFFHLLGKLSGTGATDINQVTGHTAATYDNSAAQGYVFTANTSVATQAHSVQQIHWMSWN